jgi:hypothetical protein
MLCLGFCRFFVGSKGIGLCFVAILIKVGFLQQQFTTNLVPNSIKIPDNQNAGSTSPEMIVKITFYKKCCRLSYER